MSFGNSAEVMDKKIIERIQQQAELKINSESNLAVGKIAGIFLRSKRKLYLSTRARIESQIRENLSSYLQAKQKESMEREGRFSRLAQMLRNNAQPILLQSSQDREKLLNSLSRVQAKLDGNLRSLEAKGATLPTEWETARQTEQMLKQFIKMVHPRSVLKPSPRIIICVPCGSTQVERRAIRESRSQGHMHQCRACSKLIPHPRAECSCGFDNGAGAYREGSSFTPTARAAVTVPPLAHLRPSTRAERAQYERERAAGADLPF
jgi:hypothetical protein